MSQVQNKPGVFYIGEGFIQMADTCVPIHAVSAIDVVETKGRPMTAMLLLLGSGFCLWLAGWICSFFTPSAGALIRLGSFLLTLGIILLIINVIVNLLRTHYLKIQVNSGGAYCFASRDIKSLRKIMEFLREEIKGGAGRIVQVNISNSSITIAQAMDNGKLVQNTTRIDGNNNYVYQAEKVIGRVKDAFKRNESREEAEGCGQEGVPSDNGGGRTKQEVPVLSGGEWERLEDFFRMRGRELEKDSEAYRQCEKLRQCAIAQDAGRMKKAMAGMPKDVFRAVLGTAVGEFIRKLLTKVLRTN